MAMTRRQTILILTVVGVVCAHAYSVDMSEGVASERRIFGREPNYFTWGRPDMIDWNYVFDQLHGNSVGFVRRSAGVKKSDVSLRENAINSLRELLVRRAIRKQQLGRQRLFPNSLNEA